jgi:hypothetical protein
MICKTTLQKKNHPHYKEHMKKAKAASKVKAKAAKIVKALKRLEDEVDLEVGESIEHITILGPGGQAIPLISYCFVHPQWGMVYNIDASDIKICRQERDLWLRRNDLVKEKRKRKT